MMAKIKSIFFDVNETLTDFSPVFSSVAIALGGGNPQARRWFNGMIEYSLAETLSERHHPFIDIGAATLSMIAAEDGNTVTVEEAHELLSKALSEVTPWPDVAPGTFALSAAGFKLATLSNSSEDSQHKRLEALGIADSMDAIIGVQPTEAYKPHRRTFYRGLSRLGATAESSLMVACHPWDLIGARAVGMKIAYVERPGTAWYPLAVAPDYHVRDLTELAEVFAAESD